MFRQVSTTLARSWAMPALHTAGIVYIISAFVYRIVLVLALQFAEASPLGAQKGVIAVLAILAGLGNDLLPLVLVYLGVMLFRFARPDVQPGRVARAVVLLLLCLALFWNALILGSHTNLMFTMNTGFTWSIFVEFFTVLSLREFVSLMTVKDFVAVLFPPALFLLLALRRPALRPPMRTAAVLVFLVFVLLTLSCLPLAGGVPDELSMNPHAFFLRDAGRQLWAARETRPLSTGKQMNVALNQPPFAAEGTGKTPALVLRNNARANVVFIILESTASEYIFDTAKYAGGKMPMPYLHGLAEQSLWFTRHFASNNSSPRSIFSIFSGLYESPETRFFSMEKKLRVPHLLDYLGKEYRAFLYTPADLDWYFPKAWFRNRGFTELNDYHRLKHVPEYKAGPTSVRDEFRTVQEFVRQLSGRSPYLAVYYSFVGHWPYPDLGQEHRLIEPRSSRDRYINNLYAQDKVIRQIVESLEASGNMQNTVLVIVGDHGEAFYQHPGNRVHSAESYNENIAAPLFIYAPGMVEPRRISAPTVHADIVPSVLDLLGRRYEAERFQGESALRGGYRRKYVFTFGNENTVTAVSAQLAKMQILRTSGNCRHFDLLADPAELRNLGCDPGSEQYRALEAFLRLQPGLLKGYNETCLNSGC
ncbi:MAG: hypothetical protein OHK0011_14280 [Turneriella sp.]